MVEFCDNCKFSRPYRKPDPLPRPKEIKLFFGLIIITDDVSATKKDINEYDNIMYNYYTICQRYPKSFRVKKTYKCGEYKARDTNCGSSS